MSEMERRVWLQTYAGKLGKVEEKVDFMWMQSSADMYAYVPASTDPLFIMQSIQPDTPLVTAIQVRPPARYYASISQTQAPWLGPFDTMEEAKQVAEGLCIGHPLFAYVKERNPL